MTKTLKTIKKAYKKGALFVHMLEFSPSDPPTEKYALDLAALFKTLAGEAPMESEFRSIDADERGYLALPTTVLKRNFPIPLWNLGMNVGLMFNGMNKDHLQPLFVHSEDAITSVYDGCLNTKVKESHPTLRIIQGLPLNEEVTLELANIGPKEIKKARQAVRTLLSEIEEEGWKKHLKHSEEDGVNEVDVIAHLKSLQAIVVSELPPYTDKGEKPPKGWYQRAVNQAIELQAWIGEHYEAIFPDPLPIFSYHPAQCDQLVPLSAKQLAHPHKCRPREGKTLTMNR